MESKHLRNCPFCKSDKVQKIEKVFHSYGCEEKVTLWFVQCNKCGGSGPASKDMNHAFNRWNGE